MTKQAGQRATLIEADRRNSETIVAMDMAAALAACWSRSNAEYLDGLSRAAEVVGSFDVRQFRLTYRCGRTTILVWKTASSIRRQSQVVFGLSRRS
jgi:ABC-type protease/lipase transport system fused ATPase/permease subunit